MPLTPPASRSTSAAWPPSRGFTSSVCLGNRAVARPLSGAFGMTPSTWPTTLPSSANTLSTVNPHRLFNPHLSAPDHFFLEFFDAYSHAYPHVQHQGNLPQPEPGQRPVPGRARRQYSVCARPGGH